MTKADLVDELHEVTGLTKTDLKVVVDELIRIIKESVVEGKSIQLRRFGTFKTKERKARVARNPRTGEKVDVPRKYVPVFKVSDIFKGELHDPEYYDEVKKD